MKYEIEEDGEYEGREQEGKEEKRSARRTEWEDKLLRVMRHLWQAWSGDPAVGRASC